MTTSISRKKAGKRGSPSPQILRAVLRLREMILTGALPPGRRVAELKLVGDVGVSRTPLRLAMETLEHEGLLARRPSGGFVVREFTLEEVQHAIELRGALEGVACRFAAEANDRPDVTGLMRIVSETDDLVRARPASEETLARYIDLNQRFHDTLIGLARTPLLTKLIDQVRGLPFASPSAFLRAHATSSDSMRVLLVAQEHHRTIAEAIAARDGARAEAIAREHARLALRNLDMRETNIDALRRVPGAALVRLG
jgi:GntR family transcriptional regulator of vanillate catabolism